MKFSANLGFLWNDRPLPDAIHAAMQAGFDAVECHWPYATDPALVAAALKKAGLPMIGLNTSRGNPEHRGNGLAALPSRESDARAAIDEAIGYARAVGAWNVHVMAGFAEGAEAHRTFLDNLSYACARAAPNRITILIEPLNRYDSPGYFLSTTSQARAIIDEVAVPNLKLMFDCYHVQIMEGDLTRRLTDLMPIIGHIQFSGVPERGIPDRGEINYDHVFRVIRDLGYERPLGAEYVPEGKPEASLDWLKRWRTL